MRRTKIRLRTVWAMKGLARQIQCEGCGHDIFHFGSFRDALDRAESTWFDHPTGVPGGDICPIRAFAWSASEESA